MNPDKEHAKWAKRNPPGTHNRMSPETKEAIQEIKREVDKKIDELKNEHIRPAFKRMEDIEKLHRDDMDSLENKLDTKVSFKIFTWVLALLMAVVIGIQGVIWLQVKESYNKTLETYDKAKDVSFKTDLIQQRLDQFEAVK